MAAPLEQLRFVPSRVDGLAQVTEVVVRADRLELHSGGRNVTVRFEDIARWPRPRWLWRLLFRLGRGPRWLPVADRDWFHLPQDRFFAFYTDPPVVVYMPLDEHPGAFRGHFHEMQRILTAGGYATFDLG
jgi:hypothetical protein